MLIIVSLGTPLFAQTTSGIITYEGMRKLDPSQIRVVINGDVVQPGSPDAPPDLPDVVNFSQQLVFDKNAAKEIRENSGPVIRRFEGGPGGAATRETIKVEPPFTENTYIDLGNQKYIRLLEIKKDAQVQTYRTEEIFKKTAGWQEAGKTKKIAGYTCKKATCPWKGETYTIWYTTDLPFTYSPINGLAPEKGVVLEIEGSGEAFKATKVENKSIPERELSFSSDAQVLPADQYEDVRNKAMADFRQKMFSGGLPGGN